MNAVVQLPVCLNCDRDATPEVIFAHEMRYQRMRKSITTEKVAADLRFHGIEVDSTVITRIEKHQRRIRLDEAIAIAFLLSIPIELNLGTGAGA